MTPARFAMSPGKYIRHYTAFKEGANKSVVTQRVLKCVVARQGSKAMALALGKKPNAANAYFRARPTGLTAKRLFFVSLF